MVPADAAVRQCGALRAIDEDIAIAPSACREAGMEIIGYRMRPAHSNGIRRQRVGALTQATAAARRGNQMGDLGRGMDAGIGPPAQLTLMGCPAISVNAFSSAS